MNFSADTSHIILIGAIELALVFLCISLFLFLQIRSLKKLIAKLKARMQTLVVELQTNRSGKGSDKSTEAKPGKYDKNYQDFINQQIKSTQARHMALGSKQDIVLDIDPETPLPRRVAALRFAILQAEKEAAQASDPDWDLFQSRYEKIFSYVADYSEASVSDKDLEEIELLHLELTNAKKRINNLEKFKALYFDLDERWQSSKNKAEKSYTELSQMAAQVDDAEEYKRILNEYHSAYREVGEMFDKGAPSEEAIQNLEEAHGEIRHLRAVATEQHSVINQLQRKLDESNTAEEKAEVAEELKGELSKQIRFVQESETCIKLLEDELDNSNKELVQLRSRLSALPRLKSELAELKDKNTEFNQLVSTLKSDNKKLNRKLEQVAKVPPADTAELSKYKRALSELQGKYNDLEEKYLDLKIQQ